MAPPLRGLREALALPARFVGVGAINTIVGLALIQLGLWLGLGDYPANAFGYAGGFGCSYLLHRRVTFRAEGGAHRAQLPRFAGAAAIAYALNLAIVALGIRLGLGGTIVPHVAATGAYAATFYWLSSRFVFAAATSSHEGKGLVARIDAITQSPALIAALAVVSAVPLLFVATAPLVDAGGHMGRWFVQVNLRASPVLQQWYGFDWGLLGNLGCDLIAQALIPVVGAQAALRIIVGIILGTQTLGILLLSRAAHGRLSPTSFFALPFIYGFPLQFGFLNSMLGIGLALIAVAGWTVLDKPGLERRRALLFVPVGFVLWLCHTMALGVFLVGAFAISAARADARGEPAWRVVLGTGIGLIPAVIGPALGMALARHGAVEPFAYHMAPGKLLWPIHALRDAWPRWDIGSLLFLLAAIYGFWRTPWFVRHSGLAVFAGLMAAIYVLMPDTILESQYADMRLAPLTYMLFLVAARPAPEAPPKLWAGLAIAGLLFTGARWTGNGIAMVENDRINTRSLSVLKRLPGGTNLVTLMPRTCDGETPWNIDRRDHISGYGLVRKSLFDSRQWQMNAGQLLKVHNPAAEPYDRDRQTMIYDRPCNGWPGLGDALAELRPAIRYVWVIRMPAGFTQPGWKVDAAAGDSVLLRRID